MAEPITIQKLTDASFDADTLGEFANEDKIVTSRLGAEYPSAPMASRLTVENGLLGARPFSTFEKMTAPDVDPPLVDGDYAIVTNDADLNKSGFWQKQGSELVYLTWNPLSQNKVYVAKEIGQHVYENDTDNIFEFADDNHAVGVTIDSKAALNAQNVFSNHAGVNAFELTDDDGNIVLLVDSNGNIRFKELDIINKKLSGLSQTVIDSATPDKSDLMHVFSYGQSLSRGTTSLPVFSTTQPYNNVMLASGIKVRSDSSSYDPSGFIPLVEQAQGTEGETPTAATVNHFVDIRDAKGDNTNYWHFIGSATGAGGKTVSQLSKGSSYYQSTLDHTQDSYDLAVAQNKTYSVFGITWTQGESDYSSKTTKEAYKTGTATLYQDLLTDLKAITQQTHDFSFISYQVAAHRRHSANTAEPIPMPIALAQLEMAEENEYYVLATPIYHLQTGSDDLHLTTAGSYMLGRYYAKALEYTKYHTDKWQPLKPINFKQQGNLLSIKFNKSGLEIDTALVSETHNLGFDIWVNNAVVDIITSVKVTDTNKVSIVTSQAIPSGAILSYGRGRDGDPKLANPTQGPRGNVRDSEGYLDNYKDINGNTAYMHNWLVMFEHTFN